MSFRYLAEAIGGLPVTTEPSGLTLRDRLFPRFSLVPGVSPGQTDETPQLPDARNYVFLIGGPTGSGKSALVARLQKVEIASREMTREKRPVGDEQDVTITRAQFEERDGFGNYLFRYSIPYSKDATGRPALYGFPRHNLTLLEERDMVLMLGNPDAVRTAYDALTDVGVSVVPILITPDTPQDLETRLALRETDDASRKSRIDIVRENFQKHIELAKDDVYSHVLHNNNSNRMRKEWKHKHERISLTDALVRSTATRIDVTYARLSQVIAFYQAIKGLVPVPDPGTVLRLYAETCCAAFFGRSVDEIKTERGVTNGLSGLEQLKLIMDDIRYRLKTDGKVPLNTKQFASSMPFSSDYLRETYWLTEIEVPRRRKMILHLNRRVAVEDDERNLDEFFRSALGSPLGRPMTDEQGNRVFSLTDRCYNHDWYSSVAVRYTPK